MYNVKGYDNPTSKEVIELTTGKRYGSASVAAEKLNIDFSHVYAVARGERGSHKGYIFKYLDINGIPIQPPKLCKINLKN